MNPQWPTSPFKRGKRLQAGGNQPTITLTTLARFHQVMRWLDSHEPRARALSASNSVSHFLHTHLTNFYHFLSCTLIFRLSYDICPSTIIAAPESAHGRFTSLKFFATVKTLQHAVSYIEWVTKKCYSLASLPLRVVLWSLFFFYYMLKQSTKLELISQLESIL